MAELVILILKEKAASAEAQLTAKLGVETVEQARDLWIAGIRAASQNLRNMDTIYNAAKLQGRQNNISLSPDEDIVQKNIAIGNSAVKANKQKRVIIPKSLCLKMQCIAQILDR